MGIEPTGGGGHAVLEDPTGRRARWLRRAGRCVFLLFLAWLLAIVLGGLGLMPVEGIPFAHVLRPSQGPPVLTKLPQPRQPSASDLRPALSAKVFAATVARSGQQTPGSAAGSHGKSATAPGQTKTSPSSTVSHGKSATAPGQTKTTTVSHGKSATAPGQTKTSPSSTVSHGKSATAPGQTKTTSTSTVKSKKP
ncbi:MAG: hypothetical protein ABSB96_07590 [Gaiellaceae bacterium]